MIKTRGSHQADLSLALWGETYALLSRHPLLSASLVLEQLAQEVVEFADVNKASRIATREAAGLKAARRKTQSSGPLRPFRT